MALLAGPLTRLFFDDPAYWPIGITFFRTMACGGPFIGAFLMIEGAFSGSGDTVPVMVVGVLHAWAFQVPFVWLFSRGFGFGPTGIWWGDVASQAISFATYFYWFSRKRWLHRVV